MAAEPKPKSQRWTLSNVVDVLGVTRDEADRHPAIFSAQTDLFKDLLLERRCADLLDCTATLYPVANSKMATDSLALAYKESKGIGTSQAMVAAERDRDKLNTFLDAHMGPVLQ